MNILESTYKVNDKVKYDDEEYRVTFVYNHGGNMVYYDLESENPVLGINYKKIQMSVHHSQIQD